MEKRVYERTVVNMPIPDVLEAMFELKDLIMIEVAESENGADKYELSRIYPLFPVLISATSFTLRVTRFMY